MPGFVIHLAVAYEYIIKHESEIKNRKEFFKGALAPDFHKDKMISHYGNYGISHVGLKKFIDVGDIDIKSDFGKGYLLHLITDEVFYNNYFSEETKYMRDNNIGFYDDYNCTNKELIKYFKIDYIPKEAKEYIKFTSDKPKILNINKIIKFIEKLSNISSDKQVESIQINNGVNIDI